MREAKCQGPPLVIYLTSVALFMLYLGNLASLLYQLNLQKADTKM